MFSLSMKGENMRREETKVVQIGNCKIGGGNPIAIQSMTNTKTEDVEATVAQILALEAAGCDIIRCAVPTMEAAEALTEIKKRIHIPLVADIHFDYRLAIAAIEHGADKIRINPGNIGDVSRVREVVEKAKEYNVPIRFLSIWSLYSIALLFFSFLDYHLGVNPSLVVKCIAGGRKAAADIDAYLSRK